jgi:hypothetical protein
VVLSAHHSSSKSLRPGFSFGKQAAQKPASMDQINKAAALFDTSLPEEDIRFPPSKAPVRGSGKGSYRVASLLPKAAALFDSSSFAAPGATQQASPLGKPGQPKPPKSGLSGEAVPKHTNGFECSKDCPAEGAGREGAPSSQPCFGSRGASDSSTGGDGGSKATSLGQDDQPGPIQETMQSGKPSEAPVISSDGWAAQNPLQRQPQAQEPQAGANGSGQAGGGQHRSLESRRGPWGGFFEADRHGEEFQSGAALASGDSPSFCQPGTGAFKFGESGNTAAQNAPSQIYASKRNFGVLLIFLSDPITHGDKK